MAQNLQKKLVPVPIAPPPVEQMARRGARFAGEGERKTRYSLPTALRSSSPVGYRVRPSLTQEEIEDALRLLCMERPTAFVPDDTVLTERALFEECSLGVLSARQSTNFRGHRSVVLDAEDSKRLAHLLRDLKNRDAEVLDNATHTHVVFSRPYRTLFTFLLTFVGHPAWLSPFTVLARAWRKRFQHADDIPTIGYLQHHHIGILADAMERAAVLCSAGRQRAQVHSLPFASPETRADNAETLRAIEELCGVGLADRSIGWRVALVAQIGTTAPEERIDIAPERCRKIGATLLSLRSERIQPGVNQDESAPDPYQRRQDMDVSTELTVMAGRAGYNAFAHWTGCDRERAKDLLLLERVDVLHPGGKERLREIRTMLDKVSDDVIANIPWWADISTGKMLSRGAQQGRKAFGLAGQRIYITGLSPGEVTAAGLNWQQCLRAVGAAASRGSLYVELMGCTNLPEGADLLAGICIMAGPVNQNDVGKQFYGQEDLLSKGYPDKRDATSLLVWTCKAKTVADPVGNEEQLLNAERKGMLVDLRGGPHEIVGVRRGGRVVPMRSQGQQTSTERAFADVGNFVTGQDGTDIPGNRGEPWPQGDDPAFQR